jgi:hypothetical protein
MPEEPEPLDQLDYWYGLWAGCDITPDEGVTCAYCDRSIGEYREEGRSVDIYWIDKENLRHLDIPYWQKDVLLAPKDIYLCMRCGKPLVWMGAMFFLGGDTPWDVRLNWQRIAVQLLASKLVLVQRHTEYQQDTGFQSAGYTKDTRPRQPGSLALDAWDQIDKECLEK